MEMRITGRELWNEIWDRLKDEGNNLENEDDFAEAINSFSGNIISEDATLLLGIYLRVVFEGRNERFGRSSLKEDENQHGEEEELEKKGGGVDC